MRIITYSISALGLVNAQKKTGCLKAQPAIPSKNCNCNYNPTVSVYAACDINGNPNYFNSPDDIPNGACVATFNGKTGKGTSLTTCQQTDDCIAGTICNSDGYCADPKTGLLEQDRLVQVCVSPKSTAPVGYDRDMAGCGTADPNQ